MKFGIFLILAALTLCIDPILLSAAPVGAYNSSAYSLTSNILISNLSVSPANTSAYVPITVFLKVANTGGLSSSNMTLNMQIVGPTRQGYTYRLNPLYPGQSYNITAIITNATIVPGNYSLVASVHYLLNGSSASSNWMTSYYTVQNSSGASGTLPTQVSGTAVPIPGLLLTSIPLYENIVYGASRISSVGLKNTGSSPEVVTISLPHSYSSIGSLSATRLYLTPNSTVNVDLLINPTSDLSVGTYSMPLNISVAYKNGTVVLQTYPISVIVFNASTALTITRQLDLINYKSISGVLTISNPSNQSLYNVSFITHISEGVVQNVSQITTSGVPGNVLKASSGITSIRWNVGSMPPYQTVYAYYNIADPRNITLLANNVNLFIVPSQVSKYSILNVVSPSIPSLGLNSTGWLNITALYTGTTEQMVTFTVTGPTGISLQNATQSALAQPNQFITKQFGVKTGKAAGTFIINLFVQTQGANYSYNLPLVVAPASSSYTQNILNIPNIVLPAYFNAHNLLLVSLLILIVIVLFVLVRIQQRRRQGKESEEKMLKIKKGIELDDLEDKDAG